jgi:hypothetical protein
MKRRASRGSVTAGIATALALAVIPATAQAESEQFASPTGKATGGCRLKASPCSLPHAADQASSRDTIILLAGTYNVAAGLAPQQNVNLVGVPGSRPVINFGTFTLDQITAAHAYGTAALDVQSSNLRNLKIVGSSSTAPVVNFDDTTVGGGTTRGYLDGVEIEGRGTFPAAWLMGTVRNSIVRSATAGYTAVAVGNLINATIINTNSSGSAVKVATTRAPAAFESLHGALWIRNSIVRGGAAGADIETVGPNVNIAWSNIVSRARVRKSDTNVAGTLTFGANLSTASPQFVSDTDLRLASASSLIDAGASASTLGLVISPEMPVTELGLSDVFSAPRIRAGKPTATAGVPDIGAAEYQPPGPVVSGAQMTPASPRSGSTGALTMRVSANALITVLVQKIQGSKTTTVRTQTASTKAGNVSIKVLMKSLFAKLTKGQYRLSIKARAVDGTESAAVYLPFSVV